MLSPKANTRKSDPVPPPLHELEAEVMEELWKSGEAPVRTVMDALNKGTSKKRAYTTYMTIMARLHRKGMLVRRREGKTDFYAPSYDRDWLETANAPPRGAQRRLTGETPAADARSLRGPHPHLRMPPGRSGDP
jgi:hypothetical protein